MLEKVSDPDCALAAEWLTRFTACLNSADEMELAELFLPTSYWRDLVSLTGNIETIAGACDIAQALLKQNDGGLHSIEISQTRTAPRRVKRAGEETLEAFFSFKTNMGRGTGIVHLKEEENGNSKAWTLMTALDEWTGHEERTGDKRPDGEAYSRNFRGPNWLDLRRKEQSYADRDPTVLVVGGGQAGLSIAARLTQLGVDTLIVDRHERIGDNWRKRYHALTLHNQVHVNHLPYMPFPPNWPRYIPKDKLANWFEAYAEAMELNFWTSTEFSGGTYDADAAHWIVEIKNTDGATRTLHPKHIVMATGVSGIPYRPKIPTLEKFEGVILHSGEYTDGEEWAGKSALVIGTGNSGHDIAQDLNSAGASVTMAQRGKTLIVQIEPSAQFPYALYDEGPPLEDCDLITASMPMPLVKKTHRMFTKQAEETDRELLDALSKKGFQLDNGFEGAGWQFNYLTRGGGYYFNVGCSDMIINGEIDLVRFDEIAGFNGRGVKFKSGETRELDLVVLATGYREQEYLVETLFGKDVRDRVGPIWGFGDGLELRNMYCRTGQDGLWFIAGSFAQCRIYSKYLALQIKADEAGLN